MIFAAMSLLVVAATASRLVAWIKQPTVWRFATIVAFATIGISWMMMVAHASIDAWAGVPHFARLIGYSAGICAAGAGAIYLLGLRTVETTTPTMAVNAALTLGFLLAVIIAWIAAPEHDVESPRAPLSWPVAVFNSALLYLAYTGLIGIIIYAQVIRRSRAVSHRVGSSAAAVGFLFGVIMIVAAVARFYARYFAPQAVEPLDAVFVVTAPPGIAGISAGTFLFITGGRLADWLDVARVFITLAPLWRLAIRRHPAVALPLRDIGIGPSALRMVAFRIRVEILDALRQTRVPRHLLAQMDAPTAIVYALRHPEIKATIPANRLVTGTDEEITAALAKAYRRSLLARGRRTIHASYESPPA